MPASAAGASLPSTCWTSPYPPLKTTRSPWTSVVSGTDFFALWSRVMSRGLGTVRSARGAASESVARSVSYSHENSKARLSETQ